MATRAATHAGTWYSSDRVYCMLTLADVLNHMMSEWLAKAAREAPSSDTPAVAQHPLCHGCKAIIAPYVYMTDVRHAGYRFAGPTLAWAYQCINPDNVYVVQANTDTVYLSWDPPTTLT